jgi:hypothetical protein
LRPAMMRAMPPTRRMREKSLFIIQEVDYIDP